MFMPEKQKKYIGEVYTALYYAVTNSSIAVGDTTLAVFSDDCLDANDWNALIAEASKHYEFTDEQRDFMKGQFERAYKVRYS